MIAVSSERLQTAGIGPAEADRKAQLFRRALEGLQRLGPASDADIRCLWTPGRIEFLGKHTDYAGGRSLLCAVERGFAITAAPRPDRQLRVHDARSGETVVFELDADIDSPGGHWGTYPMTLARRIARNFPGPLRGANIALASDLPAAAGMSSSSAFMVGLFLTISAINELTSREEYRQHIRNAEELAGYLGAVENGESVAGLAGDRGVGTLSGCEDQTAILCGRPRALIRYSFCPVRFEQVVPLPADLVFAIAASGVVAEKAGGALEKYNAVSRKAAAVLAAWRRATGRDDQTLAAAVTSDADAPGRMREILRAGPAVERGYSALELLDRFEQFLAESEEIIPAASDALRSAEIERLGVLVDRSQAGAERLLGNQIAETIWLARSARELGAVASSAFGAGFGGSVWALISTREVSDFITGWRVRYVERFPEHAASAEFFTTAAGPPAQFLD